MDKKSINISITQIAKDTGLDKAEISMALSANRLLNRNKLKKIVDANYPLEPFVFGRFYLENDTANEQCKASTEIKEKVL
ncbi:MAG: hypothetical protein JKY28_05320 [Sulfurimonas sp.]|nr:hypothetical protein [Sulfurimonas sp.]PHQ90125.1 MAG: hypothetical protein COB42_05785 [Sulfurimonas sp.]